MKLSIQSLFTTVLHRFFKQSICYLCRQTFINETFTEKTLCHACIAFLPHITFFCQHCGIPLPFEAHSIICGKCLHSPPMYQRTIPCFLYEDPIKTLIQTYKFNQKLFLAPILGTLMTEKIQHYYHNKRLAYPECIIPVPIHPKRLRERGYHQVYEIAKILSKKLLIPVKLNTCRRTQHSPPQSTIPVKSRKNNVRHAFFAQHMTHTHIALLDDVITTGATITSLCHTLKRKNPHLKIDVWCLARTKPNG